MMRLSKDFTSIVIRSGAMIFLSLPCAHAEPVQTDPKQDPPVNTSKVPANKPVSAASAKQVAAWKAALTAHFNGFKRYPGSGSGTSTIAVTIDRSGRVLSARLNASSGNALLDQEALALAKRASPVPAPPGGISAGNSVKLTVPIRFAQKQ